MRSMNAQTKDIAGSPGAAEPTGAFRANYLLFLLTFIYALNFLDRNVINILLDPIKKEFALSDTLLGLLTGFGFLLFYSLLGIPIARWADRGNRRSIVAVGLALWSVMTALSGFATNVVYLALARLGVGVGESACVSPSHSLIADAFPKDARPRAMGIYATGAYWGIFLGYFIGGWVNQFYGWRAAFLVAGLPGLLVAVVLRLTVVDPPRGGADGPSAAADPPAAASHQAASALPAASLPALRDTLRFMAAQKTLVLVLVGFVFTSYTNFTLGVWLPSFLRRVHHLSSGEIGTYAGTIKGLLGIAGALLGGFVVERLGRRDDRWKLLAPALASALGGPALLWCLLADSLDLCLLALAVGQILIGFHLGVVWAVAQTVVRARMRAFASSVLLLPANLVGLGFGPLAIGMMNDALSGRYGDQAVRYSLITAAAATVIGSAFFWLAARFIRTDIGRALAE